MALQLQVDLSPLVFWWYTNITFIRNYSWGTMYLSTHNGGIGINIRRQSVNTEHHSYSRSTAVIWW